MSFDQALDQLAREAHAEAPPDPARLQHALDELVDEARHWAIQKDLLHRRLARRRVPPDQAPPTRPGADAQHAAGRMTQPAEPLNDALDELARQAGASPAPTAPGPRDR